MGQSLLKRSLLSISSFSLLFIAICSSEIPHCLIKYSLTSSACIYFVPLCSLPVLSACIRQIGLICSPVFASYSLAFFSRNSLLSNAALIVSSHSRLALLVICKSSFIMSQSLSSRPLILTRIFPFFGGVAESSRMIEGLNPLIVFCAISL